MKLVSEIAVNQQTRTRDRTFERVPDPNRPPVLVVQPRLYLVPFWPKYAKSSEHTKKTKFWICGLQNSYIRFRQDWTKMAEL